MIKDIELINFRNHHNFKTSFSDGLNVIIGTNGAGKTNILEAIFMLAMTKSFRTNVTKYTIEYDQEFAKIIGHIDSGKIEFIMDNRLNFEKIYKYDDVNKNLIDIFGLFNVILFEPNDLNIVMTEPERRRKYFNAFISQMDKKYFDFLIRYSKCIKSRNKLLEGIAMRKNKQDELDFWNHQITTYGSYIMAVRAKYVLQLNNLLSQKYKMIASKDQNIEIDYKSSIYNSKICDLQYYTDEQNNKKLYGSLLQNYLDLDISTQKTNYGIHRDDFIFKLNGNKVKYFASRGEIRSIVIALKIVEIEMLSLNHDNLTILLDDIFSELDEYRKNYLLEIVSPYQTIVTMASLLPNMKTKKIIELG